MVNIESVHSNIERQRNWLLRGNTAPRIPGDGNCQLYALAWWFYGKQTDPSFKQQGAKVRQILCQFIEENPAIYQEQISALTNQTVTDWLVQKRKDKEWGDEFFLSAACRVFQVEIRVQLQNGESYLLSSENYPNGKEEIVLHYNYGNGSKGDHYEIGNVNLVVDEPLKRNLNSRVSNLIFQPFQSDLKNEENWIRKLNWKVFYDKIAKDVESGKQPPQLKLSTLEYDGELLYWFPKDEKEGQKLTILPENDKFDQIIVDNYHDPKVGLKGIEGFYHRLCLEFVVSRRRVERVLKSLQPFQEMQPFKKRVVVAPLVTTAPRRHWQMDLITFKADYLKKENRAFINDGNEINLTDQSWSYLLTVIDIFSKYAYAYPLLSKDRSEVIAALKNILEAEQKFSGQKPKKIQSDNGGEFKNEDMASFLKSQEIEQVFSRSHSPQANGCVERFNGTIKRMLYRFWNNCAKNKGKVNRNWVDWIPTLLENYNSTPHSTTLFPPVFLHKPQNSLKYSTAVKQTHFRIQKNADVILKKRGMQFVRNLTPEQRKDPDLIAELFPIKVGDKVRISVHALRDPQTIKEKYAISMRNWTSRVFTVEAINPRFGLVKVAEPILERTKSAAGWFKLNEVLKIDHTKTFKKQTMICYKKDSEKPYLLKKERDEWKPQNSEVAENPSSENPSVENPANPVIPPNPEADAIYEAPSVSEVVPEPIPENQRIANAENNLNIRKKKKNEKVRKISRHDLLIVPTNEKRSRVPNKRYS